MKYFKPFFPDCLRSVAEILRTFCFLSVCFCACELCACVCVCESATVCECSVRLRLQRVFVCALRAERVLGPCFATALAQPHRHAHTSRLPDSDCSEPMKTNQQPRDTTRAKRHSLPILQLGSAYWIMLQLLLLLLLWLRQRLRLRLLLLHSLKAVGVGVGLGGLLQKLWWAVGFAFFWIGAKCLSPRLMVRHRLSKCGGAGVGVSVPGCVCVCYSKILSL